MRVLLVTPSPPQPSARTAVPVVSWAQLLSVRARHEITIVTTAGPDPLELEAVERLRADGIEIHALLRQDATAPRRLARWVRNAGRWLVLRRPMYTIWYYEPELQRLISALLAERRFDLVHVNDSAMGSYRLPGDVPRLLVEIEARAPRPADWTGWMRGNWYRGIMEEVDWHWWPSYQRHVWRGFDRIETFTERDAATIRQLAPEVATRVHVNPFGIDLPPAASPAREEHGNVAFVGNYTHAPNVDAALWLAREVMPLLRPRHLGARLHLYGSDPRGALTGVAAEDVHVHGWVEAIEPMLERASVIAAPVRIGGGQRMKVLQAMAMGKAVVTTPRGADGVTGADGPEPPIAVGRSADEIADLIATLLRDDERRRALGARARASATAHHDLAAYGRRIDAAYAALHEHAVERQ